MPDFYQMWFFTLCTSISDILGPSSSYTQAHRLGEEREKKKKKTLASRGSPVIVTIQDWRVFL